MTNGEHKVKVNFASKLQPKSMGHAGLAQK